MSAYDRLYRFTFEKFPVRGEIVVLDASWKAVVDRHAYPASVLDYLGQTLVAATLMSATIKLKGALIVQLQGDGPLQTLVAQATDSRTLRGMARVADGAVPVVDDLHAALGNGRMVITAEAANRERYQGIVAVEQATVAAAVEAYFAQSEQLPTRLWLAASTERAAGLLLQRMPSAAAVDDDDWRRVCLFADTLGRDELLDAGPETLLRRLFHEDDVRLFDPEPVAFRCSCSKSRIEDALRALGQEEVDAILRDQGAIEADCEFCNAHYHFDAVDTAALFVDATPAQSPDAAQ
ncbi:MAG: Hsp33 family molecular chaperone HslO [Gammaproteobacteria bacterium]|nr:Hsp33 family molecular chaperone HslO [Gammaproteobacteria bacterium]